MEGLKRLWPAQWPLTILVTALLFSLRWAGPNRMLLLAAAVAVSALVVLLWLSRRIYEGSLFKRAQHLAESGQHAEALRLLAQAEEAWTLNVAHHTPKNIAKDYQRLTAIVTAIQGLADRLRLSLDSKDLLASIAIYIKVYSDKKNLIFGTHTLKAAPKAEIKHADEVFPALRSRFQEALAKALGVPPTLMTPEEVWRQAKS